MDEEAKKKFLGELEEFKNRCILMREKAASLKMEVVRMEGERSHMIAELRHYGGSQADLQRLREDSILPLVELKKKHNKGRRPY
jgi:hypothetical protein